MGLSGRTGHRYGCGGGDYILFHLFFQAVQEPLRDRGEDLIFFPDQVHLRLQSGGERTEGQAACGAGINQMFKCQEIAKPFFDKEGGVVGEPEGAFQMELVHVATAPAGDVGPPTLFGAKERETGQVFSADLLFFGEGMVPGHDQSPDVRFRESQGIVAGGIRLFDPARRSR